MFLWKTKNKKKSQNYCQNPIIFSFRYNVVDFSRMFLDIK